MRSTKNQQSTWRACDCYFLASYLSWFKTINFSEGKQFFKTFIPQYLYCFAPQCSTLRRRSSGVCLPLVNPWTVRVRFFNFLTLFWRNLFFWPLILLGPPGPPQRCFFTQVSGYLWLLTLYLFCPKSEESCIHLDSGSPYFGFPHFFVVLNGLFLVKFRFLKLKPPKIKNLRSLKNYLACFPTSTPPNAQSISTPSIIAFSRWSSPLTINECPTQDQGLFRHSRSLGY